MEQRHIQQHGTFHIVTNTKNKVPWCTWEGVPEILIDNLCMTRNILRGHIYGFCILPDHIHILLNPGPKGLSVFMHSFKRNSSWHIRNTLSVAGVHEPQLRDNAEIRWQNGFYDERIRDAQQRSSAIRYIQENAYKHTLVKNPSVWRWSSIHFEDLLDPLEIWLH